MKATLFALFTLCIFSSLVAAEPKPAPTPAPAPCCREPLPPTTYSQRSVYSLQNTWTSDLGKTVKLDILRGRPVVLALFFTRCQHSCPIILKELKDIENKLTKEARARTDFVLVSIDPMHDTPETLAAYRAKNQLPTERWMLLRGERTDVDALAEHIGFKYTPGSDFQFGHSAMISILNSGGEIIFRQAGLGVDRREAVQTLEKQKTESPARTSNP